MKEYNDVLRFIEEIIGEAGEVLKEKFLTARVSTKGDVQNTVTEADLLSEKLITNAIEKRFPNDLILGEEAEQQVALDCDALWIIDPLDGTNNYASGMPHYGISIAYCENGEPVVGAIFDPERGELFTAIKGNGAFLNGESIAVSKREKLEESLIATGFYYDRGALMEKTLDSIKNLFHHGLRGIRRAGSAALDLVWTAAGRFDGYYEYQLSVWDFAAGALIVREAGGIVSERDGSVFSLDSTGIIVASDSVVDELVSVVKWEE